MIPNYYFNDIYEITPEFLQSIDVRYIVCDIDNTLVTYADPEPTPSVLEWFDKMRAADIRFVFLSNNHGDRVTRFASALGFPYFPDAKKPDTAVLEQALAAISADKTKTASLGDQIFTDMKAGDRAGLKTILVPPINDLTDIGHRLRRKGEYFYMRRFFREHPGREDDFKRWKRLTVHKVREDKIRK